MEKYNKILKQITWLYATFIIVFVVYIITELSPSFMAGVSAGIKQEQIQNPLELLFAFPIGLGGLAIAIITILLIIQSAIALYRRDIFKKILIRLLSLFSIIYLILVVLVFTSTAIFGMGEVSINTAIVGDLAGSALSALVVYILSRVLIIGKNLKEEQELTI